MLDLALKFDTINRRCDLVFNGTDMALDTTPLTPLLLSLGCDRRAHPDDVVPTGQPGILANAGRGWAGDSLDPRGELTGSRLWELQDAKESEETRRLAQSMIVEAVDWIDKRLGVPLQITVQWQRRNFLGYQIKVGQQVIKNSLVVGQ